MSNMTTDLKIDSKEDYAAIRNSSPDFDIVISNLNNLIDSRNISQKDLSTVTGYSEAAISKYFNKKIFPPIDFLYKLKMAYGISIDEFVTKIDFESANSELLPNKLQSITDEDDLEMYRKYCGTFIVYYLDTSSYKGREYNEPFESVCYGVVNIHEIKSSMANPEFEALAAFGIYDHDEAIRIKDALDGFNSTEEIERFLYNPENNVSRLIYRGPFEFGTKHARFKLKHGKKDEALIIIYKVPSNKEQFIGGLGVINSCAKGRESAPTAQVIAFARSPLSFSEEEIHHNLQLTYADYDAKDETKKLIDLFKFYYLNDNNDNEFISDYQKELIMRINIETSLKKIMSRNNDRFVKISESDDTAWYKLIKKEMKNNR